MIRYNIITKHDGIILDAELVARVVTTRSLKKPSVIVFVEPKNQEAFEKYIEGCKQVIEYAADPRQPGEDEKEWKRS